MEWKKKPVPVCILNGSVRGRVSSSRKRFNNILGLDTSELRFGSVQNLYLELETRPLTEPFRSHVPVCGRVVSIGGSRRREEWPPVQYFSFSCSFRQKLCQTRIHSSRMRTVRSSSYVYPSMHWAGRCVSQHALERGCLPRGGMCIPECTEADIPPMNRMTDRQV